MTDREFHFIMCYLKASRLVVALIGVLALAFAISTGA